jgi:hypothetical protein
VIRLFVLLISLHWVFALQAQEDFSWWNQKHNWDGCSPWTDYLTISTSFMGPNAIPVPEMTRGMIDSAAELEVAGDYYFSRGDKTKDFYLRGYLPLFSHRMSVTLEAVPYEWFTTDTITRDARAARTRSGKGGAGGDIYFTTCFSVLKEKEAVPGIALRAALRTASCTNLRNARFTDGAGYFFDVSAGKNFSLKKCTLRLYVMSGFYDYQTFDVEHLQNDCFLYGVGADLNFNKFMIAQSFSGYNGYLEIGDKPVVYNASIKWKNNHVDLKAGYEWGVRDYDFQRVRLSVILHAVTGL